MGERNEDVSRREFVEAAGLAAVTSLAAAGQAQPTLKSDRKVRIGVVGGRFGASFQWHLDPNCTVEAVSDLIPERRAKLQKVYQCPTAYESLEKLVLDPKIEAVAVFTGAPDHTRHVIECFEKGKHVISAVPACLTLEEAAQMKEVKERTGLKYMMAETSVYRAPCILARQVWKDGAFGRFLYSEVEYYHHDVQKYRSAKATWQGKATEKGWRWGFPPMLYPTHCTAFHVGVTRERLTRVSCLGWGHGSAMLQDNPYDNPFSNMVALFQTSGGNTCRCNVLWRIHASGERAQWLGENASMYMGSSAGQPFLIKQRGKPDIRTCPNYFDRLPKPMRVRTGHGNSHTFLTHEFIAALVEEREPAVDLYEALAMTVPGIVAMESARKGGEQLEVPRFEKG